VSELELLDAVDGRGARLREPGAVEQVGLQARFLKHLLGEERLRGVAGDAQGVVVLDELLQQAGDDPADAVRVVNDLDVPLPVEARPCEVPMR